jgi:hypothetical protein
MSEQYDRDTAKDNDLLSPSEKEFALPQRAFSE